MYEQYFQQMPDEELTKAVVAFQEYVKKYEVKRDTDGMSRMKKLVEMAKAEIGRRQKES